VNDTTEFLTWCESVFNEPPGTLTLDMTKEQIGGWDSMGLLMLMADLDEIHGIQLTEQQIEELATIADIARLIEEKSGG